MAGLAALTIAALAQSAPAPAEKPAAGPGESSDDAMTDVDPDLLARCKREAAQKKLTGADRQTFMNACVEPED
ncbi:PsiF family protein [Methylobacterium sp. P31]